MRINHVLKTDQWRAAPQIRAAPDIVVSQLGAIHTHSPAECRSAANGYSRYKDSLR